MIHRTNRTTRVVFILYGAILIWIVLFKMAVSLTELQWLEGIRAINTQPFRYSIIDGRYPTTDSVLNVVIFIPLGVYLRMLERPLLRTILWGGLLSVAFEICQYALAIGVADVTDVITNTAGVAIGVCLYALAHVIPIKRRRDATINTLSIIALAVLVGMTVVLHFTNR